MFSPACLKEHLKDRDRKQTPNRVTAVPPSIPLKKTLAVLFTSSHKAIHALKWHTEKRRWMFASMSHSHMNTHKQKQTTEVFINLYILYFTKEFIPSDKPHVSRYDAKSLTINCLDNS